MSDLVFDKTLSRYTTPIDGLYAYDIPLHGDNRGWFKENWQREKMLKVGLPDFKPVQNNVSFNEKRGVTRGLHAEPWDKFISIGCGRVFGAWCDIRENSKTYGKTFTIELDPSKAIFVPRGIANGFQTLEDNSVYMYLVNDHWSPNALYSFVSVFDKYLDIKWPIPLDQSELSEKDRHHPALKDVVPIPARKTLVVGGLGQLGTALKTVLPFADFVDRDEFDITDPKSYENFKWRDYDTIINAAAYTAVDAAETPDGRVLAWKINASAVKLLADTATTHNLTLVHISSEYVFDGSKEEHLEDEPLSPLSVYAQSKAAGDIAAASTPKHYLVRTSWVVGEGSNFIRTMASLAKRGIKPSVVDDQIGRLTFTDDLAKGILHLLKTNADFGTYNLSNTGKAASWSDIAKRVYRLSGKSSSDITPVSTVEYFKDKSNIAPRPLQSTLNLAKIEATGFSPRKWEDALEEYVRKERQ